jgi:hypothetical protein
LIKIKEIKTNNVSYYPQKYKGSSKNYSQYINYRNYGNPHYNNVNFYSNRYGYQSAYQSSYINYATEEYYYY